MGISERGLLVLKENEVNTDTRCNNCQERQVRSDGRCKACGFIQSIIAFVGRKLVV
jgi:ribosomal protein L37E